MNITWILLGILLATLAPRSGAQVLIDQLLTSQPLLRATDTNPVRVSTVNDTSDEFCGTLRSLTSRVENPNGVGLFLGVLCGIHDQTLSLSSDVGKTGTCVSEYTDNGAPFSPVKDLSSCDKWLVNFLSTDNPVGLRFTAFARIFDAQTQTTVVTPLSSSLNFGSNDRDVSACAEFLTKASDYQQIEKITMEVTGTSNADAQLAYFCCVPEAVCWHDLDFLGRNTLVGGIDMAVVTISCINYDKQPTGRLVDIKVSQDLPALGSLQVDTLQCDDDVTQTTIGTQTFNVNMENMIPGETRSCSFTFFFTSSGSVTDFEFEVQNLNTLSTTTSHNDGSRVGSQALCEPPEPSQFVVIPPVVDPQTCPPFSFSMFRMGTWRVRNHPNGAALTAGESPPYCLRVDGLVEGTPVTFDCEDPSTSGIKIAVDGINRVRIFGEVVGGLGLNSTHRNGTFKLIVDMFWGDFSITSPPDEVTFVAGSTFEGRGEGEYLIEGEDATEILMGQGRPSLVIDEEYNGYTARPTLTGWLRFFGVSGRGDWIATVGECVTPEFSLEPVFPANVTRISASSFQSITISNAVLPYGLWHLIDDGNEACLSMPCDATESCVDEQFNCQFDDTFIEYDGLKPTGYMHIFGNVVNANGKTPFDISFFNCVETFARDEEDKQVRCNVDPGHQPVGTLDGEDVYQTSTLVMDRTFVPPSLTFTVGLSSSIANTGHGLSARVGEEVL